jgi:dolichyl-phosphate beta-glucosyltransferase
VAGETRGGYVTASVTAPRPIAAEELFLVVPAYNPGRELSAFLIELAEELQTTGTRWAVQVVDDGSHAEARERISLACERARANHPQVRPTLVLPSNRGKGAAIRAGWQVAESATEWLAFVDADGSVPAKEVVRLWERARAAVAPVDAIISSRVRAPGRNVERRWHRHCIGRVFATLTTWLLGLDAYDTQCGLKFVRGPVWKTVQARVREDRFAFDVALLSSLRDAGSRVHEEPIDWADRGRSTVRLWRDAPAMLLGLLRVRRRRMNTGGHG